MTKYTKEIDIPEKKIYIFQKEGIPTTKRTFEKMNVMAKKHHTSTAFV